MTNLGLLLQDLPCRDCESVSCDEPGKPYNAFTCINWGGNSLTVSVGEMPLPKPKVKKPSKPCNGVGCKKKTTLRCWACAAPACRGCRAADKTAPACGACLHASEQAGTYTQCHPDDDGHGLCGACSSTIVLCQRGCKNPAICQTHAVICPSCDWGLRDRGEDPTGPPRRPGPGELYETVGGDLVEQQVYGFHMAAKTIKYVSLCCWPRPKTGNRKTGIGDQCREPSGGTWHARSHGGSTRARTFECCRYASYFCKPDANLPYHCDHRLDSEDRTCGACERVVCDGCLMFCQSPQCDLDTCAAHRKADLGQWGLRSAFHRFKAGRPLCYQCKKTGAYSLCAKKAI